MGNARFAANGAWKKPRVLMVQQRGIGGSGLDRSAVRGRYATLHAKELKSDGVKSPYRLA